MSSQSPNFQYEFLAIGESLIDIISNDSVSSLKDADTFRRFIGGQATNLAMNISRLGKRVALATCLGDDGPGKYIQEQLMQSGIDSTFVQVSTSAPTTISIIARSQETPDFIILRGADSHLETSAEIVEAAKNSRIVHTSAFALSRKPTRTTILDALQAARSTDKFISLDPNYHPYIWPDISRFTEILKEAFQLVDITKPSLDDCERIFGFGKDPLEYAQNFIEWGARHVVLTMGSQGVLLYSPEEGEYLIQPSRTHVADVTGAGDAFWAGMLTFLMEEHPLIEAARAGQALAEIKIGSFGPLSKIPDLDSIYQQAQQIPFTSIEDTFLKKRDLSKGGENL
jgi:sugar/nucleoside kinase (ribokinase family)